MAVISFKCPNCDGELIFDPSTQKYKCEYCASLFSQPELDAMKPASAGEKNDAPGSGSMAGGSDRTSRMTGGSGGTTGGTDGKAAGEPGDETQQEEAVIYTCPSCGAEIITDRTTAATFCYYCHNPVVIGGRLSGELLPNRVIPFEVTRQEAETKFLDYVSAKKFVPRAFFQKKQIERMSGVYFPYWLYDVELEGRMDGTARNIRVWRTGDIEYTETKHYAVRREGDIFLRNLPENALRKANAKLTAGVLPYDFQRMKEFHMGYLSGFLAECRDIRQTEVAGKMQGEMRESAQKMLRDTVTGFNSVTMQRSDFHPKRENWSYVLLPVWTITYRGRNGKIYYYSMNGQNGRVCGELPVDRKKLALVSGIAGLLTFILGLIGGFFI